MADQPPPLPPFATTPWRPTWPVCADAKAFRNLCRLCARVERGAERSEALIRKRHGTDRTQQSWVRKCAGANERAPSNSTICVIIERRGLRQQQISNAAGRGRWQRRRRPRDRARDAVDGLSGHVGEHVLLELDHHRVVVDVARVVVVAQQQRTLRSRGRTVHVRVVQFAAARIVGLAAVVTAARFAGRQRRMLLLLQ